MVRRIRGITLIACLAAIAFSSVTRAADMLVFFGTHISGPGKGFSIAHFDSDTGKITTPQFALETPAPQFFVCGRTGSIFIGQYMPRHNRGEGRRVLHRRGQGTDHTDQQPAERRG